MTLTKTLVALTCAVLAPAAGMAQTDSPPADTVEPTLLLTCMFGTDTVDLVDGGTGLRLKVGELFYPAAFVPDTTGTGVSAIFTSLDIGPMMIAVATKAEDGIHIADVSATTRSAADGLASRTTRGTCTEGTN